MRGTFPGLEWERAEPRAAGFDPDMLSAAGRRLEDGTGELAYRAVVVRDGRIAAEWGKGIAPDDRRGMASAAKSLFSSILGIAVAEGKIGSADDPAVRYFPEMMDVSEGRGPKPGRCAKPEDRAITLRQLISNTSGYMKPGETPGAQFHYQTFGMNILCHAVASAYGLYDSSDPDRLPGLATLIEERIRDPIGGAWTHGYSNFGHPPGALIGIFGNYTHCNASARDMARMGLLWLRFGRWGERQVIPEDWLREATRTSPDILRNCPPEQWCYGHGFWTNDHGLLWPQLPTDSFAASGAGRIHVWCCPSLDLVVAQSPGIYDGQSDDVNREFLGRIVESCA
jgi:CubicO group peptidase (beta-lactamase class C family)